MCVFIELPNVNIASNYNFIFYMFYCLKQILEIKMKNIEKSPVFFLNIEINVIHLLESYNVWFGLVSLFYGISTFCRLFNAKAILLEEQ